jgi:hypothetical protein
MINVAGGHLSHVGNIRFTSIEIPEGKVRSLEGPMSRETMFNFSSRRRLRQCGLGSGGSIWNPAVGPREDGSVFSRCIEYEVFYNS